MYQYSVIEINMEGIESQKRPDGKIEFEKQIAEFRAETETVFDLNHLERERLPLDMGEFKFEAFTDKRVNHYCIKSNESEDYVYGEIDGKEFKRFIKFIESRLLEMGFDVKNRYCFITIDQGIVDPDQTLRYPGWHIDGMQGDEVPTKKAADLQFIWSDSLPTTFTYQKIDTEGLDPSVHNVFNWIGKQVDPQKTIQTEPFHVYAMNTYHVHRATEAKEKTYRRFVRVAYTFIPVTSKRMTVNPDMKYNYKVHQTTGEIPPHLR